MAFSLLKLDEATETIVRLTGNIDSLSPADSGILYVASLAFLCHLKSDNEAIEKIVKEQGNHAQTPASSDIPAIAAVLNNIQLFRALLQWFSIGADSADSSSDLSLGRKRALSIGDQGPSKILKHSHSPVPSAGGRAKIGYGADDQGQDIPKPAFNPAVLAATIFYGALRPFDHWPAPLVKAYCDDCFGGRNWVDRPECHLLVQNLSLVHSSSASSNGDGNFSFQRDEADAIEAAYRGFEANAHDVRVGHRPTSSGGLRRKRSHSSTNLGRRVQSDTNVNQLDSSGSSSGEEVDDDDVAERSDCEDRCRKGKDTSFKFSCPQKCDLSAVRQRYFGSNKAFANELLSSSLSDRLNSKAKQSSGLLLCLPSFMSIPKVRQISASNLEHWLQSPALAGLARVLFSSVVTNLENADPPLPEDLAAIASIVSMRLKANQLSAHIANIVSVAQGIPNAVVVDRMYSKLLHSVINQGETSELENAGRVKMIVAIHRSVPSTVSYNCLATAVLRMLAKESEPPEQCPPTAGDQNDRLVLVRRLHDAICTLAGSFAPAFDGCALLDAFLAVEIAGNTRSTIDEEDKARLMSYSLVMHARFGSSPQQTMQEAYLNAKTKLLAWCCNDYLPRFNKAFQRKIATVDDAHMEGAMIPAPNYQCVFSSSNVATIPSWLVTIRSVLFLDVTAAIETHGDERDRNAIERCCELCHPVNDEMVWTIVRSCAAENGLTSDIAVQLLENIFWNRGQRELTSLQVTDPMLVWELYGLTRYTPPRRMVPPSSHGMTDSTSPQLALSSLWWRVSVLALIMCAASLETIGKVIWTEHPTLRSLIKMVTSNRFRFPTVDCDEITRGEIKAAEQCARDQEAAIAESLFLAPSKATLSAVDKSTGSRTSTRLRQKETDARLSRESIERKRRKSLLRALTKSIMVWDPVASSRKPPKEAAELLVSVQKLFNLSAVFQSCTRPDFLLMTLGGTSRNAVERACDWLLPIISEIPTTISRLPSSASCFLLLRAYGSSGQRELKLLSSPLLRHVTSSLKGEFGIREAVKALHLLLQDMASVEPEKRRCARRVFQVSLRHDDSDGTAAADCWLLDILKFKHAAHVVQDAIQFMASAAALERGKNLVALVIALEHFVSFAQEKSITPVVRTAHLATDLMSTRHSVFAEAMTSFPTLRSWALRMVTEEFEYQTKERLTPESKVAGHSLVSMQVSLDAPPVCLPIRLLEAAAVLLSTWNDQYSKESKNNMALINKLSDKLFRQTSGSADKPMGLASAVILSSAQPKVPIEMWMMLAKARSDAIARLAALSAPIDYLPRLLLSSGLPRASLVTMVDRLGRLGNASSDKGLTYNKLLEQAASGVQNIGRLRQIATTNSSLAMKLKSRIAANLRLGLLCSSKIPLEEEFSTTFLDWLSCWRDSKHSTARATYVAKRAVETKRQRSVPSFGKGPSLVTKLPIACSTDEWIYTPPSRRSWAAKCKVIDSRELSANCETRTEPACMFTAQETFLNVYSDESILAKAFRSPQLVIGPDLWTKLFVSAHDDQNDEFLDMLTTRCALYWDRQEILSCLNWIAGTAIDGTSLRLDRMLFFVVVNYGHGGLCPMSPTFSSDPLGDWLPADKGRFLSLANVALHYALESEDVELGSRPLILLLLASYNRDNCKEVATTVMGMLQTASDRHKCILSEILLGVYMHCPFWVNEVLPMAQPCLARAADHCPKSIRWPSAMDTMMDNCLSSLPAKVDCGLSSQGLADIARQYPLYFLGRISSMTSMLRVDATAFTQLGALEKSAQEEGFSEKKEASFENRATCVTVRHWGHCFTESLWLSLIDIVATIPDVVLYESSATTGMLDFLSVYLQLLSVHVQLPAVDRTLRLQKKLSALILNFKSASPKCWKRWLLQTIEGGEIGPLLLRLKLVPPDEL